MRSYIFTEAEKSVLHKWLAGKLLRENSALLHTTLGRLRRAQPNLIRDLKLFTLVLRRLRLSHKLRRLRGRMDTTLALAPIHLHIPETALISYLKLRLTLEQAQSMANDEHLSAECRLKAVEIAAKTARALIRAEDKERDELNAELEELKKLAGSKQLE